MNNKYLLFVFITKEKLLLITHLIAYFNTFEYAGHIFA